MTGLEGLVPPTKRVTINGREVDISPLRIRQIPGFARAIAKPWLAIVGGDYLVAIMEWPKEITEALSIATGLDPDFLDDALPDEYLGLCSAVFEVNLDFFGQAVFPKGAEMGRLMAEIVQKHSALQPGLSATDTATPTSLTTPLPN